MNKCKNQRNTPSCGFRRQISMSLMIGFGLLFLPATPSRAARSKPVNLLKHSSVSVARSTIADTSRQRRLTDGQSSTAVIAKTGHRMDIVYFFNGRTVAPCELEIQLGIQKSSRAPAARFDVLSSAVSSKTGYQSLRCGLLKASAKPQRFRFLPVAARWILVRIIPLRSHGDTPVAEIAVRGHDRRPIKAYCFAQSPAAALAEIKKSIGVSISRDEAALFADARDGKLGQFSFAEAALIASGVTAGTKRRAYLRQIDKFEREARSAIADAKSTTEKGRRLLAWLHAGPMKAGYRSLQTRVSTILDERIFNCVSSATLYNILGRRFGLDLRAVERPRHAFSRLYVGTWHYDVETTTRNGFAPARNRAALAELTRIKGAGFIAGQYIDRYRETRELGLVALIYYNRGIQLSKAKQQDRALLAYFSALSLDAEAGLAVTNAIAVFNNWGLALGKAGRYPKAMQVIATGRKLAPQDRAIRKNISYLAQKWLTHAYKKNGAPSATKLANQLKRRFPQTAGVSRSATSFAIRIINEQSRKRNYAAALKLVRETTSLLSVSALQQILRSIHDKWARSFWQQKKQYDKGLDIYRKGLKALPGDSLLTKNAVYVWNQKGMASTKAKNWTRAIFIYRAALKEFPKSSVLKANLKHCQRVIGRRSKAG